jgi:hypothetical protein
MIWPEHKCYGCDRWVENHEQHIHVTLDEWCAREGLSGDFGLDDILGKFAFCSECIEASNNGWTAEEHEIERS